ncbi:MAG TPA: ATP-binding protein [Thermoanaerobaculia bacterium]|nr:ATP-binding protein [Thermoanaerobaculia bacterium]
MRPIALDPIEIEQRREQRARRLALSDIPLLRVVGSVFLTVGVYLNNRFLAPEGWVLRPWWSVAIVLAIYAVVSWAAVRVILFRASRDLTLLFLFGDIVIWSYAIYATGAEKSWLFFIPVLRVADQMQTHVRRCIAFTAWSVFCFATMLAYVEIVDGRPVGLAVSLTKLTFIGVAGMYISMSARTSENRRAQMAESIRVSRDLIHRLEHETARAEEANAAKSDFLANMSHEMRTPLHGVIGMLQLARDGETSPQRIRQLDMAQRSAESLLGTIDDILDFSRIEARRIELEPVYFSVRGWMNETMKPLGITASAKSLGLAYIVNADVPDSVWGDSLRLRQIVINLVGNAIKFTQAGEIAIRVSLAEATKDKARLAFEVRDTGLGIIASQRESIFQPFTQGDAARTRGAGGTGLGLAIVARLVEAMGGTIDLESEPGKGSAFHFVIPTETDPFAAAVRQPWESGLAGKSMLIVDPQPQSRAFLAEMLRSRGIFATACESYDEAPKGRYALTIGVETREPPEPFVLICSPLAAPHIERVHVTRPVSERELFDAVGIAVGLTRPPKRLPPPLRTERGYRLRVLVVDDHPVNQEFAAEALRRMGHIVAVAMTAEESMARLESERFDLILMDVQLPGIDGLEATRRIRATDRGKRTRIIAMTAFTRKEDRDRCLAAGMDAVLTKPIDMMELSAALRSIEPDTLLDIVDGNVRLLARVSEAFALQTPPLVDAMREAILIKNPTGLFDAAHKLKGSVSHFGTAATELATEIEEAAREGNLAKAAELMPRLDEALADLERRLTAAR